MRGDGERIAYARTEGSGSGVVFLGGFKSAMTGTKALALERWAGRNRRPYLRFDYFGHGRSSGRFEEGTVTRWRDDALAALDNLTRGPQILVGSSMGAWIALLAARQRVQRIAGLVLIAPAADFTEALLWAGLSEEARREIRDKGLWLRPSAYDPVPYPITRALIEDGRRNLVLDRGPIALDCPVRILQGMRDPDVPWTHALKLVEAIQGDVIVTLIKTGDHRLSTPRDLRLLEGALDDLLSGPG